jgi:hypothetical protein
MDSSVDQKIKQAQADRGQQRNDEGKDDIMEVDEHRGELSVEEVCAAAAHQWVVSGRMLLFGLVKYSPTARG